MKKEDLRQLIHRYAEDREIDYTSAKVIGEQQGLLFKNENELLVWKQSIDEYLKRFDDKSFDKVFNLVEGGVSGAIMPKYSGSTTHDHRNDLQKKYDDYKKAGGGDSFAQFAVHATSLVNAGKSGSDIAKEQIKLAGGTRATSPRT